jgi:Caspase domain
LCSYNPLLISPSPDVKPERVSQLFDYTAHTHLYCRNLRVFALLIGIDDYDFVTPKLQGCKNDVESMKQFLTDAFTNPTIECLIDKQATRQAILNKFKEHFSNNREINEGDVMVFYFAGHGSRVDTPEGWKAWDGKIETICPCDQAPLNPAPESEPGSRVGGIPDHEINVLLRGLAKEKGNNIVRNWSC